MFTVYVCYGNSTHCTLCTLQGLFEVQMFSLSQVNIKRVQEKRAFPYKNRKKRHKSIKNSLSCVEFIDGKCTMAQIILPKTCF